MPSQRLREFLEGWCGLDADAEETAQMLDGPDGAYYRDWLPGELDQAIRGHEITPEFASTWLNLYFENQEAVDGWLRRRWDLWFRGPGS